MKSPRTALVATVIPLLLTSLRVTAGELPFNAPTTEEAKQSASLLHQTARALHDGDREIANLWLFPTADASVVFARYNEAGTTTEHLVVLTVNGNHIVESRELTSASAELVSTERPRLDWSAFIGTGDPTGTSLRRPKVMRGNETNIPPPPPHWTASIGTGTAAASTTTVTRTSPPSAALPVIAVADWTSRIGTGHALDSTSWKSPSRASTSRKVMSMFVP
jgi:hypothetical protein